MSADSTADRITTAALSLFFSRGVRKTDLTEVAYQAGVARITVYRYCGDKKGLVRAVCLRIAAIFQEAAEDDDAESTQDINRRLNQLGQNLATLPKGNLLAWLEEMHRLYPDVYDEFQTIRQTAVDHIFQQGLKLATRERALREGINPEVLKAIFGAAIVGLLENPTMISANISLAEIFATVAEVFRYGVLIPTTTPATSEHTAFAAG
jgi:AcrR family transcriptional regulator